MTLLRSTHRNGLIIITYLFLWATRNIRCTMYMPKPIRHGIEGTCSSWKMWWIQFERVCALSTNWHVTNRTKTHTKLSLVADTWFVDSFRSRFTTFSTIHHSEIELIYYLYYLFSTFTLDCPFTTCSLFRLQKPYSNVSSIIDWFAHRPRLTEMCLNKFQLKNEKGKISAPNDGHLFRWMQDDKTAREAKLKTTKTCSMCTPSHARQLHNWIMAFFCRRQLAAAGQSHTATKCTGIGLLKHVLQCRSPASATFIYANAVARANVCVCKVQSPLTRHAVSCERYIHRATISITLMVFLFCVCSSVKNRT